MVRPLSAYLHRLELRSQLSEGDRGALLAIEPKLVFIRSRHDLVRPGERVEHACLVKSGLVARSEQFADGARHSTAVFVPGDMADLHSVVVSQASWALTALTDCEIYQVPHQDIAQLARSRGGLREAFWRDTIADASILSKWVSVLSRPALQRVAHLLCELGYRLGKTGRESRDDFELPITQEQFAELAGVTPNHVYRTLRELRSRGLIDNDRRRIRIADYAALTRAADFDPRYLLFDRQIEGLQL